MGMELRVFVAQTQTGLIYQELNQVTGNMSDDIAGDDVKASLTVPFARGLRELLVPWRNSIVIADDDATIWWAGPIVEPPRRERGQSVTVTAGSLWSLLKCSPAYRAGSAFPPAAAADLNIYNKSPFGIMREVLTNGLQFTPLPVAVPDGVTTGWSNKTWPSAGMTTTESALKDMIEEGSEEGDLGEIHFRPRWKDGVGQVGNRFEWQARIGAPLLGNDDFGSRLPAWVWDGDGPAVRALTESGDSLPPVSAAIVGGQGQEEARIVGYDEDLSPLKDGYPMLYDIDGSSGGSATTQIEANSIAMNRVAARSQIALVPVVHAWGAPDAAGNPLGPRFGSWAIGDDARFDVISDGWVSEGQYPARISGWSHVLGDIDLALNLSPRKKAS